MSLRERLQGSLISLQVMEDGNVGVVVAKEQGSWTVGEESHSWFIRGNRLCSVRRTRANGVESRPRGRLGEREGRRRSELFGWRGAVSGGASSEGGGIAWLFRAFQS